MSMKSKGLNNNVAAGTNIGNISVVSASDTAYPALLPVLHSTAFVLITSDHVHVLVFSPTVDIVFLIPMKASWSQPAMFDKSEI